MMKKGEKTSLTMNGNIINDKQVADIFAKKFAEVSNIEVSKVQERDLRKERQ